MARIEQNGVKFQIAFKKLMLHIALDQVRTTYELLLRDLSAFEHKANLKKLKSPNGGKLQTNYADLGLFIAKMMGVNNISNAQEAKPAPAQATGGQEISTADTNVRASPYDVFGIMASTAILIGLGAVAAGGAAAVYALTYGAAELTAIRTWAELAFAGYSTIAAVGSITSRNVTDLNDLYLTNLAQETQKIDKEMQNITTEFYVAYRTIFKMNCFRKLLVIMNKDY